MFLLKTNGLHRVSKMDRGFKSIVAEWVTPEVTPAGTLTFTVDGDAGTTVGSINLASKQRVISANTPLPFVDIQLVGLPTGGAVVIRVQ